MDIHSPICSKAYPNDFIFRVRFWLVKPEKITPDKAHNSGLLQRREKLPFISGKVQRDKQAESMPNKLVSRYDAKSWQVQSMTDKAKIYPARRVDSLSANAYCNFPLCSLCALIQVHLSLLRYKRGCLRTYPHCQCCRNHRHCK